MIVQWIAVLLMGLVLGLLGGGGGILAVPILVGFFKLPPEQATGASLLIVGMGSMVGAIQGLVKKQYELKPAIPFAIASVTGAFLSRLLLVPNLPKQIGPLTRGDFLLTLLSLVMLIVAYRMLAPDSEKPARNAAIPTIAATGFVVGVVSGTLGAGGGFLIVPALTMLLGMGLKVAIPTSLFVISVQSLGGFLGELSHNPPYEVILPVAGVALVGMVVALALRPHIKAAALKKGFGVLVLAVAIWILVDVYILR